MTFVCCAVTKVPVSFLRYENCWFVSFIVVIILLMLFKSRLQVLGSTVVVQSVSRVGSKSNPVIASNKPRKRIKRPFSCQFPESLHWRDVEVRLFSSSVVLCLGSIRFDVKVSISFGIS